MKNLKCKVCNSRLKLIVAVDTRYEYEIVAGHSIVTSKYDNSYNEVICSENEAHEIDEDIVIELFESVEF